MEVTRTKLVRGWKSPNLPKRQKEAKDYIIKNNDEPIKGKLEDTKEDHENSREREEPKG